MCTQSHYVVDYCTNDPFANDANVVVEPAATVTAAKAKARKFSRKFGSAYVIRCTRTAGGGVRQHGQAVYYDGAFSHTDGDFAEPRCAA